MRKETLSVVFNLLPQGETKSGAPQVKPIYKSAMGDRDNLLVSSTVDYFFELAASVLDNMQNAFWEGI